MDDELRGWVERFLALANEMSANYGTAQVGAVMMFAAADHRALCERH
jgi:hypothetical protein